MPTIPYPHIRPEIVRVGPFALRWYGLMYLVGYAVGTRLAKRRVARGLVPMPVEAVDRLVGYLVIGMLAGARLTYALVYDRPTFARDPLEIVRVWHGGLSFHGAVIGMAAAAALFARRQRVPLLAVLDTMALCGTPGLGFGRLGNFINGELYGRPTTVPWAMIFPTDPQRLARHPSQLYEAFCEGVLLYLVLRALEQRSVRDGWYRPGLLTGAFLLGYAVIRFALEFTRQPDAQLGLVLGPFSMGQLLSAMMAVAGVVILRVVRARTDVHPKNQVSSRDSHS
jgi:phosphatidylglycerol:prolipoprotein diacylglycerol transferase